MNTLCLNEKIMSKYNVKKWLKKRKEKKAHRFETSSSPYDTCLPQCERDTLFE